MLRLLKERFEGKQGWLVVRAFDTKVDQIVQEKCEIFSVFQHSFIDRYVDVILFEQENLFHLDD